MTPEGLLRLDGSCVASEPFIPDVRTRRFDWLDAVFLMFLILSIALHVLHFRPFLVNYTVNTRPPSS